MTLVPTAAAGRFDTGAVPLPRYAQLIGYAECAFFGIRHSSNTPYACREIWTKAQRDEILKYLQQAQAAIENILGYPLQPTWIAGEGGASVEDRFVDEQRLSTPLLTRWGHVIEGGQRATALMASGANVDFTTEPATVGPFATTVTDATEVHVYLPGTDIEVHPSEIAIAGGLITLRIPRCRLVAEAWLDNPESGWSYADLSRFTATVDVKRVYNDPSVNAELVKGTTSCGSVACADTTLAACLYVRRPQIGAITVRPATYASGTWTASSTAAGCACNYDRVRLWYRAGVRQLDYDMEDAIVRLAHAMMPNEPCGCSVTQALWKRDRAQPEIATRERLNCPFGLNDGAWIAYQRASWARLIRARAL